MNNITLIQSHMIDLAKLTYMKKYSIEHAKWDITLICKTISKWWSDILLFVSKWLPISSTSQEQEKDVMQPHSPWLICTGSRIRILQFTEKQIKICTSHFKGLKSDFRIFFAETSFLTDWGHDLQAYK